MSDGQKLKSLFSGGVNKNLINIIIVFVVIFAITVFALYFSLFNIWQEKILDKFFIAKPVSNTIVIFTADNESINKIGQWPWSRSIFAQAINKLQRAKTVAIDINFSEASNTDPSGDFLLSLAIINSKPKVILPIQINEKTKEEVKPLPDFQKGSLLGLVNILNDDGTIREVNNDLNGFSSFGALSALQYNNNLAVPNAMRIDYAGPQNTFTTLPINDLLQNKVPESVYDNKIVLIGTTASDLHDFFQTPFGLLSGVEINANIINTILTQKFYIDLPFYLSVLLILLFNIFGLGLILKIKRIYALIISLVVVFASINILGIVLFNFKIIYPILYINFGFIITSAVFIIYQYIFESKEKKFIYNSFKYYLAPDIINDLVKDPKKLKLGGERKKITVLFSDIRGFTSISESMSPEQLTHFLNEYLTKMTDVIMNKKGLVDKYIGDAVMAFWGAPLPNAAQAENACMSAIKMMQELDLLNEHWKKNNVSKELHIGIGINTGEVVVGNFGSQKRFNYTILGDAVNLASRLESLTKVYGASIIITDATKKEIEKNPIFKMRELDTIIVKGKKEPKVIFEVLVKDLGKDILAHFEQGRIFYKKGDWDRAIEQFNFNKEVDGASKLYLERCLEFKNNPPENWQGVYEFKNK